MPSSEDKKLLLNGDFRLSLQHFEKILLALLAQHRHYKKQVLHLTEENQALKMRLQAEKNDSGMLSKIDNTANNNIRKNAPLDGDTLARKLTAYIKEIDLCLAYFEQA